MTDMPALQKILEGILQTEGFYKHIHRAYRKNLQSINRTDSKTNKIKNTKKTPFIKILKYLELIHIAYCSITALNTHDLKLPVKINRTFLFVASEIHILSSKINTNRVIGEGIPSKWNYKASICYYPNPTLRQNSLQTKTY